MTKNKDFVSVLIRGYDRWVTLQRQGPNGRYNDTTQNKFCDYLGVEATSFSRWMGGSIPGSDNLAKLAVWYGKEIYEVASRAPQLTNDPESRDMAELWNTSSPERREVLLKIGLMSEEDFDKFRRNGFAATT